MRELPWSVVGDLSAAAEAEVMAWWAGLSEEEQAQCVQLWTGFALELALDWVVAALPVDPHRKAEETMWQNQLYEYLMANPERQVIIPFSAAGVWKRTWPQRRFHICRADPAARAALKAGHIPAGFPCRRSGCPMQVMLARCPGQSLRLVPIPAALL